MLLILMMLIKWKFLVGFQVLTMVVVEGSVFWGIMPCSPTFRSNTPPRSSGYACYLLHAGFLLGLFMESEGGGDMFPRNVG
jgi:hypothetical protein